MSNNLEGWQQWARAHIVEEGGSVMALASGTKVKWMGLEAKVVGADPQYPNLLRIELTSGEVKVVNEKSVVLDVPADPIQGLPQAAKEAVLAIRKALGDAASATPLMSILRGATRGPDNGHAGAKTATTAKLRRAAWGAAGAQFGQSTAGVESITEKDLQDVRASAGSHFESNIRQAAKALGIYKA